MSQVQSVAFENAKSCFNGNFYAIFLALPPVICIAICTLKLVNGVILNICLDLKIINLNDVLLIVYNTHCGMQGFYRCMPMSIKCLYCVCVFALFTHYEHFFCCLMHHYLSSNTTLPNTATHIYCGELNKHYNTSMF